MRDGDSKRDPARIAIRVMDRPEFFAFMERVTDFIFEYASHHRSCSAIDVDGDWNLDSEPCDCGYEEALAAIGQRVSDDT